MSSSNVKGRRRKERKIWRNALLASLLFHLLAFVVSSQRPIPKLPLSSAGPNAADLHAARGGMQAMSISFPPPRPLTPPAIPIPTEIEVDPVDLDIEVDFDLAVLLGEPGLPGPPGLEGEGAGTGAEGQGVFTEPRPQSMIMPPTQKRFATGVWVFVNESGRVVADSTRLDPPTKDRKLNRRLIEEAAEWRFYPATRNGEPVAAWLRFALSFG